MSHVSFDPDELPDVTEELTERAERMDKKIVYIMLEEHDKAKVGEPGGVSYFALADFIPRIGDVIATQDEVWCKVKEVIHKTVKSGNVFVLVPNVLAVRYDPSKSE